jgi:hypothetical protein
LTAKKKARATGNSVAFFEHEKVLIFKVKVKGFPPCQVILVVRVGKTNL